MNIYAQQSLFLEQVTKFQVTDVVQTELTIVHLVLKRPGIYLHGIAKQHLDTTGAVISLLTICRFLQKIGFTHQRLRLAALQLDDFLRSQLRLKLQMFIFLDEPGSDKRNSVKR